MSKSKTNSIVVSKLPDAGLGNKLFCWAHGVVFAERNQLDHYYSGLTRFKPGPFLRGERSNRYYKNYFKNFNRFPSYKIIKKPVALDYKECDRILNGTETGTFVFNQIPHWSDYFEGLREHISLIKERLLHQLSDTILQKLQVKQAPVIGVHIRMGDFKKLQPGQDFAKVGAVRTPLSYFSILIEKIRAIAGKALPVTIFSDGKESELEELLLMENVSMAEKDLDVIELLHLSKSKIIILSAGSTFGQWSAFLSDAVVINHYQHFHAYIRDKQSNAVKFEGIVDPGAPIQDPLLIKNIQQL